MARLAGARVGGLRSLAPVAVAILLAGGGLTLTARPVAAEWLRTLTIDFYTPGGDYGGGKGHVTSDDESIDCSYDTGFESGTCSKIYHFGDFLPDADILVTFTPATGSYVCLSTTALCQEAGGAQTFPVHFDRGTPGDVTITPSFNLRVFEVHVDVRGRGSVTGNGAFCPTGGNRDYCGEFKYGMSATLTAHPNPGYNFNFWDGDFARCFLEPNPTCSFSVTA